jgi:ubiquinone/menaquinone biosynthesis C-methylase UbiE
MMRWLDLPRVPEPEVMDDSGEVEAYASATQAYLDKVDDTFVVHALRLLRGRKSGRGLDIGTGPGQIVVKLARLLPGWAFVGVDRSPNMIAGANRSLKELIAGEQPVPPDLQSEVTQLEHLGRPALIPISAPRKQDLLLSCSLEGRVEFVVADGNRLDFPDRSFDFIMCNSVLHHLAEPQCLFAEVKRLLNPDGAILIRDLRRPSRLAYPLHVRWHGRHYSGLMYQLYCASVRSAYTVRDLKLLLQASPLAGARVFTHERTHLGVEQPVRA